MFSDKFLSKINLREPVYLQNYLPKLMSWAELESLLNLRPFMNDSRVRILGNESYDWYASEWSTDVNTFPASLLERETKKYVFYLKDCSRVNKQINDYAKSLEDFFNTPIDVHAYFSLIENPDSIKNGFGIHKDKIDVIIVQSEGISQLKIWEPNVNFKDQKPKYDLDMTPGSVVYVPAGYYHEVISKTKRLSLSFAFGNKFGEMEDRYWLSLTEI